MTFGSYYYYGFVNVDINGTYWGIGNWTCPGFDSDVAGSGVVTSFLIAGLMTTSASITAAVLQSRVANVDGGPVFLPGYIHRWLARGMTPSSRERSRFWLNILERLILNLADQQLITGFSLLIIAYIIEPWPLSEKGASWPSRLSLVIYLSCLSSSSHLACMLTLHKHLQDHAALAKLRIFFITLFAMALSISIGLGQTFNVIGYLVDQIIWRTHTVATYKLSLYIGNCLLYGLPPLIALHVYWTAILQLWPSARGRVTSAIRGFHHHFTSKAVPRRLISKILGPRWSKKLMSAVKSLFWWLLFLNPPMIFASQVLFANVSIAFILMQKFAGPKMADLCPGDDECEFAGICNGLNNPAENKWGFGQMLAMFVLVLPVLAAIETYQEEKAKHHRKMASLEDHAKSTPDTPRHSRAGSTVALLSLPTRSPRDSFAALPSPDVGGPFGRTPSFRSATSQYMPVPQMDSYSFPIGDHGAQTLQNEGTRGRIAELQRLYHPDTVS